MIQVCSRHTYNVQHVQYIHHVFGLCMDMLRCEIHSLTHQLGLPVCSRQCTCTRTYTYIHVHVQCGYILGKGKQLAVTPCENLSF